MTDIPIRAFETEHDIMGFEFKSGSLLFLKASEGVELGQAVIFEKDDTGGCLIDLESALSFRDGSLVFVNSQDFDSFINDNNIEESCSTE